MDGLRGKRVRQLPDGSWWSDINPPAHRLAQQRVLASADASAAWDRLGAACRADGSLPFPVHVWVAGRLGTACRWDGPGGIADMTARLPAAAAREFRGAGHSIHSTQPEAFVEALVAVINAAATGPAARAGPAAEVGGGGTGSPPRS